ncbi:hypothetical protein KI387_011342, partial [Taxus chinensis]
MIGVDYVELVSIYVIGVDLKVDRSIGDSARRFRNWKVKDGSSTSAGCVEVGEILEQSHQKIDGYV